MSEVYWPQCRAILSVVFDGFGGTDSEPTILQVIPRDAQVHLNGYKEADTWELAFDAKSLPVSPDLIRALGVEIYMFDAGSVNPTVAAYANDANLLVAGLADNADIQYGGDGRSFTCDGRDYTALLIDRQWDPRRTVPVGKKLSEAVQTLVDEAVGAKKHGGRTIVVEYVNDKAEPIVGAQSTTKTKKNGSPVKTGVHYWDVIYRMVAREGLICFMRGFHLIISDPQTLTLQNAVKSKKVAYGQDLASLKVERKLGKEKVPQVIVRSYSSKARTVLEAKFPAAQQVPTTGIGTNKEETQSFSISGVDDVETLKKIAECKYNSLARAEAKVHFTTKSLKDVNGSSLLSLRAGDPIVIGFDPYNDTVMLKLTPEGRYQNLLEQGYSRAVAALVAQGYDKIEQFKRPFYTKEVGVTWSHKDGISLDVEAMNFVSADRDDATAKANPRATTRKLPKSTDPQPDVTDEGVVDEGGE